jgi:phosphatidylethanolamine/phosphatidyl-N-methylethanolamine N-methyltransferase
LTTRSKGLPYKSWNYRVLRSNSVGFLKEFISKPVTTGAVAPSSPFLAQMMVDGLDLASVEAVLEYGPGTGAFTGHILREMKAGSKFAAIELNPAFAGIFKAEYPGVRLAEDSVANARAICDDAGIAFADCIVSGLPWGIFSQPMQVQFLDEMMRVLKPGGRFVTFGYVHTLALTRAKRFASLLPNYFASVSKSPVVWRNLPPAFVYRCLRGTTGS